MTDLRLNFACGLYDRMLPIYTREIKPAGIDLNFTPVESPREVFDRFTSSAEFDVAEFSITEFVARLSMDQCPFIAIPAFPSRAFRHGAIAVNVGAGVRTPKDLAGGRIGVPLYSMTAAVWIRGHLEHDFGVDLSNVTWVEGAMDAAAKYGNPNVMPLIKPVRIERAGRGASLGELLTSGDLIGTIGTGVPAAMHGNDNLRRLFPDYQAIEKSFFKRTGIFPIMHLIAIRRGVYEKHPKVAQSLYDAFCKSKALAQKRMRDTIALRYMLPWLSAHIEEADAIFGGDGWPYGIDANRRTLETLMELLWKQGLTTRRVRVNEVFVHVVEGAC